MLASGKDAAAVIKEKGLEQISDTSALDAIVDKVLAENQKIVDDYRSGKKNAINALQGRVMRETRGQANPAAVMGILTRRLESDA